MLLITWLHSTLSHQNREYSEQGRQLLALTYVVFTFCSIFLISNMVLQRNWLNFHLSFYYFFQLAKKIREKFNRYLDVVNRNKQVVEASYTAHLTSPLTAIQDCCTIPPSMME